MRPARASLRGPEGTSRTARLSRAQDGGNRGQGSALSPLERASNRGASGTIEAPGSAAPLPTLIDSRRPMAAISSRSRLLPMPARPSITRTVPEPERRRSRCEPTVVNISFLPRSGNDGCPGDVRTPRPNALRRPTMWSGLATPRPLATPRGPFSGNRVPFHEGTRTHAFTVSRSLCHGGSLLGQRSYLFPLSGPNLARTLETTHPPIVGCLVVRRAYCHVPQRGAYEYDAAAP